jgi:hypothetical protein
MLRGRGSAELVEKVGRSNTGIVQEAIRLRCFRKHKLKDPKGKEENFFTAKDTRLVTIWLPLSRRSIPLPSSTYLLFEGF